MALILFALMDINQGIQILLALLYAISIVVMMWVSHRELRNTYQLYQKQSEQSFFSEYTRRYQDIILSMPAEVYVGNAPVDANTLRYLQIYFDLCSEEYHLYKNGFIPADIWKNWKEGMQIATKTELYRHCWNKIKGIYNQDFYLFFEREIIKD